SYSGKEAITEETVRLLTPTTFETDVFKTIDALARRDIPEALRLLLEHKGAGDDPFQLFSMFAYEVRTLLVIKEAQEKGFEKELTSVYKLHPYVVRKNNALARAFQLQNLVRLHSTLATADLAVKTGRKEAYEALEDVILAFEASPVL
ncbi:MAG TPA: hypothetical protein VJG29_02360, partial [Candidatus Paceibacterota bacterium]